MWKACNFLTSAQQKRELGREFARASILGWSYMSPWSPENTRFYGRFALNQVICWKDIFSFVARINLCGWTWRKLPLVTTRNVFQDHPNKVVTQFLSSWSCSSTVHFSRQCPFSSHPRVDWHALLYWPDSWGISTSRSLDSNALDVLNSSLLSVGHNPVLLIWIPLDHFTQRHCFGSLDL